MSRDLEWWEKPPIMLEPTPHISQREILATMPKELHPAWESYLRGMGVVSLKDGDLGIFPWDFFRFLDILEIS